MWIHRVIWPCIIAAVFWASDAAPQSLDPWLDRPTEAEARAAYLALPIVVPNGVGRQKSLVRVKSCSLAAGRPGVVCTVTIEGAPTSEEHDLTMYFSRGPDSAWVAAIE
jgi:hypothetical protein